MPKDAVVADVGCNNGIYTALYQKVTGVKTMEGFDIAEDLIREAEKNYGFKTHRWQCGLEPCPAADHSFDVILCCELIEHLVNTEFFIKELHRILKPGGKIILTTPNLFYWLNRIKILLGIIPYDYPGVSSEFKSSPGINPVHLRMNSIQEWGAFFHARGFKILEQKGIPWVVPENLKSSIICWIDSWMPSGAQSHGLYILTK